jgi:type I restriction enzyme S subunit
LSSETHWSEYALGDIAKILGGGTPSTSVPAYWGGDVPWLVPSEVSKQSCLYVSTTRRTITRDGLANSVATLLPPGTVMMTSRATIGEVAINAVPMTTNQGFINVVCKPEIVSNEFLAYWIAWNKQRFIDRAHGVTFKEVTKSNFKSMSILLPPLQQQSAIAQLLKSAQAARELRRRELSLEGEHRVALRAFLLAHGTVGEQTRSTSIGEIPQSWGIKALNEVADLYSGGTPSKSRADWWNGSIPWASTKDLKKPRLLDVTDHVTEEAVREGSRLAPAMSLFIGVRGMILAKEIPICLAEVAMAFNQDVKAAVPREGVNPEFLLYALNSRKAALSPHIGTSAHGTRRISSEIVASLELPIPSDAEQSQIAAILTACDRRISALEREQKLLGELFFALLEGLMSGRIDVKALVGSGAAQ